MLKILLVFTIAFSLTGAATAKRPTDSKADQAAINKTSEAVRAAFARGDVPAILSYHHPDVTKALAYHKYLVGQTEGHPIVWIEIHCRRLCSGTNKRFNRGVFI